MHLVMLALPFVLRGLISSVIADISYMIEQSVPGDRLHGVAPPLDPTDSILEVLNEFMVWYLTVRAPVISNLALMVWLSLKPWQLILLRV